MSKRHKHVKPSGKKSLQKAPKKRGSEHPKKTRSLEDTRKRKAKLVSKNAPISKGRTPSKTRRGNAAQKSTQKPRSTSIHRKGAKKTRPSKSQVRRGFVERLKRKREIELEIERLESERENLAIEETKTEGFSNKRKPIEPKRWIATKEGQKLKEKKIKGYRYVYHFKFPRGTFEKKVKFIRKVDLSFLNHALKRAVVAPRAVSVTLESKTKDGRRRYLRNLSAIDFVVNLNNIKKFILETMIEWQDRWHIGILDRGDTYLTDYEEYNPDYLYSVSIQFIY